MGRCPRCGRQTTGYAFCPDDGAALVAADGAPEGLGQIDRYRLVRKIGEGASSEVFEAEHVHLGKRVAIKVLRRELARDPRAVERVRREARTTSAIGHGNIVEVEDFGSAPDGSVYLVMEWLRGETLAERIERGPLALAAAIGCVRQICAGLMAAHEAGVVHRDLKPANVYLAMQADGTEVVKLLDFGVARLLLSDTRLTQHGMIVGTPDYIAPEQALGEDVDLRADLYSVGVLLYRLATGTLPFSGDSLLAILHQHAVKPPEPPRQRAPDRGIPAALEAVIMRCLEKRPENRFATADQLRRALDGADDPGPAAPPGPDESVTIPAHSRLPLVLTSLLVAGGLAGLGASWILRGARPADRGPARDAGAMAPRPAVTPPAPVVDASPARQAEAAWTLSGASETLDFTAAVVPGHVQPDRPFQLDVEMSPKPALRQVWAAGGVHAELTVTHFAQHAVAHRVRYPVAADRLTATMVLPSAGKHHVEISLLAGGRRLGEASFDLCVGVDPAGPTAEVERVCPRMGHRPRGSSHHH